MKVQLSTFRRWRVDDEFDITKETIDGSVYVTKISCKICKTHGKNITRDPRMRGVVTKNMRAFIDGTTFVSKHTVTRHLAGKVRIEIFFQIRFTKFL